MSQKFVLLVALTVSAGVLAQNQPNPGAPSQQPPPTVNVITPPGPNIYVVSGGLYGTGLYSLPYLPMAPSQNTAPQQAGTAGISFNSPTTYSGPGYSYATPLYYSNPASPYYNATPVVPGTETTVAESGRQINDMGPSVYVSASAAAAMAAAPPPPSVAEVAAQYRSAGQHSMRTYTNADAWRLGGSQVVPGIIAANVLPTPPPNAPAEPEQPQAPPPSASQTPPPAGPERTAPPAVPPPTQPSSEQQAAPPPPGNTEESAKTTILPATSTLLPLLGALGLLSGAAGLFIARFRR